MANGYDVIVDEVCPVHGGRNYAYQYHDENFVRIESVCEGCNVMQPHQPSAQMAAERAARQPQARPQRPSRTDNRAEYSDALRKLKWD